MDTPTIRAAISADPALRALVPDTNAIAARLSAGRVRFKPTLVGVGSVLSALGLEVGGALCDVLQATPAYRHVWPLLRDHNLRIDDPQVRAGLQMLVGMQLSPTVKFSLAHAEALLALGQEPDPVDELAVRRAVYLDDGTIFWGAAP